MNVNHRNNNDVYSKCVDLLLSPALRAASFKNGTLMNKSVLPNEVYGQLTKNGELKKKFRHEIFKLLIYN